MTTFQVFKQLSLVAAALAVNSFTAARAQTGGPIQVPLVTVSNLPPIQLLVPGFTVRELPFDLNNINNFVYAPDGRLFALCYDGNVLQLKDTDGDGLEDTATHFYLNDKNAITTCIDMAWGPGGLYVGAKGRVVRLRDKGDGTAELETLTSGWSLRTNAVSDFDTYGIAVDREGNVFFGLCTENMRNAYLVNTNSGESSYDLKGNRGTIMKLPARSGKFEIYATGFRYPTALEFNAAGDLFALDQEGATWLPNGNPLDELMQIQRGRHYGFPPRHPKYLPNVIDEPNVFDYGPQHQSTCDLHFNEGVAGSTAVFGPEWWRGDAIVTGESRGKLFRTKLVKTAAGYVAQNQLLACLTLLTIEAAPTPQGDLLVSCHSGKPDWGTGPQGKGKLYKISYTATNAPLPVLAYAASPTETRIIFDRPLPSAGDSLARDSKITTGVYVSAGDRFESFRPGYRAVKNQLRMPRFELPMASATVAQDHRSLTLKTTARTEAVNYAVTLPASLTADARSQTGEPSALDLLSDLTGIEATWRNADGKIEWSGWLPHPDLLVAEAFTRPSEEHQRLFQLLKTPGTLSLRGQLDLYYMLRARTQPDSKLDFEYPVEKVTLTLKARDSLKLESNAAVHRLSPREVRLTTEPRPGQWISFAITLATGAGEPKLDLAWFTQEDSRPRALPLRRVFLPWVTPRADALPTFVKREIPEITGGDWKRGREFFFSEQVACFKCHQMRGEGGTVGPDLSNLIYRDYTSVLQDVAQPSAALDPDYLAYNLQLTNGESATGVLLKNSTTNVVLGMAGGTMLTIPTEQIVEMKASTVSLMPENLLNGLNEEQRRDLMTFLLAAPPQAGAPSKTR